MVPSVKMEFGELELTWNSKIRVYKDANVISDIKLEAMISRSLSPR
jgi:hypothetical protein